jgi:hypothetical protein
VVGRDGPPRSGHARLCRRERDECGDDSALWAGAAGTAGGRGSAAQPRAERHPAGRHEPRRNHRGDDHDRGHRWGGFALFVGQILVPSLQPGQVVIWDNLSVHRNQKLRRSIEAAGCHLRFLPAYSPDFSPIEHAFSKLKTALRQAGARERAGLEDAIAAGLATITAEDAAGWFGHCGYAASEQLL